jgi:hypothetical protein
MNWYTIISVVVIPLVVMLLKKLNLPSKWCPIAAFAVALVLVGAGKAFGVDLDVNNIAQAIVAALATAGVSVLGYDTVKKLTEAAPK